MDGAISGPRKVSLLDVLSSCQKAAELVILELAASNERDWHIQHGCWSLWSLQYPRLACKELRRAIDHHVPELTPKLHLSRGQNWVAVQLPSLARFSSCYSLSLQVESDGGTDSGSLAALVSLPFVGLELSARQRFKTLLLRVTTLVYPDTPAGCGAEVAATLLASKLPNLQKLDVHHVPMSYNHLQQLLMYEALAALPRLQELRLPCVRALDCVGALVACNHLTSIYTNGGVPEGFSQRAIEGISRLQSLRELHIGGPIFKILTSDDAATAEDAKVAQVSRLRLLLTSLPASLGKLAFSVTLEDDEGSVDFWLTLVLQDRRLLKVDVESTGTLSLPSNAGCFSSFLELLVSWLGDFCTSPQELIRIKLSAVHVGEPLAGPEWEHLHALMQSFQVEMKKLIVWVGVPAEEVVNCIGAPSVHLEMLGSVMQFDATWSVELKMDGQVQQQHQIPPPIMSTPQLVKMLSCALCNPEMEEAWLGNMLAREDSTSGASGSVAYGGVVGDGADLADTSNTIANDQGRPELLLLQGEFIAILAATSPAGLGRWLRDLSEQVAQAAGFYGQQLLTSYLVLPEDTAAIIVECSMAGCVAAVVNKVRSLAGVALQAVQVPVDSFMRNQCERLSIKAYETALQKVLQLLWNCYNAGLKPSGGVRCEVFLKWLDTASPLLPPFLERIQLQS